MFLFTLFNHFPFPIIVRHRTEQHQKKNNQPRIDDDVTRESIEESSRIKFVLCTSCVHQKLWSYLLGQAIISKGGSASSLHGTPSGICWSTGKIEISENYLKGPTKKSSTLFSFFILSNWLIFIIGRKSATRRISVWCAVWEEVRRKTSVGGSSEWEEFKKKNI